MIELLLIRHAATTWNVEGRLMGRTDPPLSDEGLRELDALLASETCRQWSGRVERVYTSPQLRAKTTAQRLAIQWGCAVVNSDLLVERDFGNLEGLTRDALLDTLGGSLEVLEQSGWAPIGGESVESVYVRCVRLLRMIAGTHTTPTTVAIVAHSIPLRLLAWLVKGNFTAELTEPIPARLSIRLVTLDGPAWRCEGNGKNEALQLVQARVFSMVPRRRTELLPNQARIALRYAALCGSDYPKFSGEWSTYLPPLPPGMPIHECVGNVVESEIDGLPMGTMVLAMPHADCGLCGEFIAHRDQIAVIGSNWPSQELDLAVLGQPTAAVLYGIDKLGDLSKDKAIVVGMGGLGIIAAHVMAARGAVVVGVEPNAFRASLARSILGIEVHDGIDARSIGDGSVVVEAVGHDAYSDTAALCLSLARPHGRVLLFGNPTVPGHSIEILPIVRKNLKVIGSIGPDWAHHLPRGLEYVRQHHKWYRHLVTHQFDWHQADKAFEVFGDATAPRLKILLTSSD